MVIGGRAALNNAFAPTQLLSRLAFNVGGAISDFSADSIAIDLSGFQNNLAGGTFGISLTGDSLSINFQPEFSGDFNNDGTVDAADYVTWRKTDSGNPQGYTDWRENFGEGMGTGGGSAGASPSQPAVPEPATLVLLMFAAAGWCLRRLRAA